MQLNRRVWSKVGITAAVCGIALMSGCASLGNSYLEHSNLFGASTKSDSNSNENSRCSEFRISEGNGIDIFEAYVETVSCAREIQNNYRKALGERSTFRRRLGTGMIGLSAATLGLGLASAATDSTLITGLLGASGAASYQWLNAPPEERAWIAGYNAIECTIAAVNPLVMPTVGYSVGRINKNISKIETSIDTVGIALRDLRAWVHKCRGGVCGNENQAGQFEQLIKSADTHLAQVTKKLDAGRKARRAAVRIAGDIQRAPATLGSAVRRIIGEVDLAIQKQALNLEALDNIVSDVAERYSSLTEIPGATADPEAQDPNLADSPDFGIAEGEMSAEELGKKLEELTSKSQESANLRTPAIEQSVRNFQDSSRELLDQLDISKNISALQELDEDSPLREAEVQEFSARLSSLQNITGQLEATSMDWTALLQEAIQHDLAVIKAQAQLIGDTEKRLQKRQELESSDYYQFQQALAELILAFQKLDDAVYSLGDITEIIIDRQPLEQLKSCGVDPEKIVRPFRVEPENLPFDSGAEVSKSILAIGGIEPYIAQSLSQEHGVMVEARELGGSVFTISISDDTPPGRYEILIGDGAGRRLLVPVQVGRDGEGGTSEQSPHVSNSNSAPAKVSAEGADVSLNERIKRVEELITERTTGEIRKAQRALCMSENQADGIWGPVTQKSFESRFGNGTTLTPETLSQLIGTKNPNSECEQQEDKPPSD